MSISFTLESWIWYALCVFTITCRTASRWLLFRSLKKFQFDDWLMFLVLASYTVLLVVINCEAQTSSNLLPLSVNVDDLSDAEINDRIYGSKLTIVVEQMQCLTIWLLKACLLGLYYRLTSTLPTNVVVKILALYIALSFIVMEILYFAVWCRPFHHYWAVPTPSPQCNAATNHLITNAVFNISSDVAMLAIAFSLFLNTRLPWNRKAILCAVFGVGIFVVLCAVLNKYYSFTHPFGSQWTHWYVRESSTNLIVANIPFLWTLLRHIFNLKAFDANATNSIPYHSQRTARGRHPPTSSQHHRHGSGSSGPQCGIKRDGSIDSAGRQDFTHAPTLNGRGIGSPPRVKSLEKKGTAGENKPWKEKGLYGREELDALAIDPWDYGNDERLGGGIVGLSLPPDSATCSASTDGTEKALLKGRRLRDEEAQYAMQEKLGTLNYLDWADEEEMRAFHRLEEEEFEHIKQEEEKEAERRASGHEQSDVELGLPRSEAENV